MGTRRAYGFRLPDTDDTAHQFSQGSVWNGNADIATFETVPGNVLSHVLWGVARHRSPYCYSEQCRQNNQTAQSTCSITPSKPRSRDSFGVKRYLQPQTYSAGWDCAQDRALYRQGRERPLAVAKSACDI